MIVSVALEAAALMAAAKELRKVSDRVLVVDGTGRAGAVIEGERAWAQLAAALGRVAALPGLTVAALDGDADAGSLAAALACDAAFAGPGLRIAPPSGSDLLRLRIPSALAARGGSLHAHRLLLTGGPLEAARLAAAGVVVLADDPLAAAHAAAERALADPALALVRRSLSAAARSTPAQAAEYEAELAELL